MKNKKVKKKRYRSSWLKVFLNTFLLLFAGFIGVIIYLIVLAADLPSLTELQQFNPESVSKIMSADGELIKELYYNKREIVGIGEIPKDLLNVLISVEDHEFYRHTGLSLRGISRALIVDILTMSTKQGASTLTQQLARNMYDTIGFDKTIIRKLKEILTAIQIERTFTKAEILELYLNSVYFGHGMYGVQAASKYYFGKHVRELNLSESATLIALLPAPARYSPIRHYEKALKRRNLVLRVTHKFNFISDYQLKNSSNAELILSEKTKTEGWASYFAEYVRRELLKIDDDLGVDINRDGLVIYTTLDSEIQKSLSQVFNKGMRENQKILDIEYLRNNPKLKMALDKAQKKEKKRIWAIGGEEKLIATDNDLRNSNYDLDKVIGYIKKENTLLPDSLREKGADSLYHKLPQLLREQFLVQGSAIVINPENGHILAMIGGRQEEAYADKYNRATQAIRQPGSVFKPFIYLTALEKGFKPTTQLLNQPIQVCLDESCKDKWNPQNHDGSTGGLTTLREGLKRSLNLISVRIVQELITPLDVIKNARKFGITTDIAPFEAIALGSSGVIPLEITAAYSAIANNGIYTEPLAITRIEDRYGRIIKRVTSESWEVKNEALIHLLRDMMEGVVNTGTGQTLRWKYKFSRPAAGKTGTTNQKADAWFVGFTPQIVMGVWVGMDDPVISLGKNQFGSKAALPIWAESMKEIYRIKKYPEIDWERPTGIIELEICKDSKDLPTQWCPKDSRVKEIFLENAQPRRQCSKHSSGFFRFDNKSEIN